MKFILALSVFFLIIFLTGCATYNGVTGEEKIALDGWIGQSREQLIKTWGRPTKETSDGQGGEIITYDTTVVHSKTPGINYENGNRGLNNYAVNNYIVTRSRIFYINPKAIIYRWDAKESQGY